MSIAIDPARLICRLDELSDPGSKGFRLGAGEWPLRGFVVRRADQLFAYVNRCPHAGHPLDWRPDRFLSPDCARIQCGSHGAQFDIESGACVAGPCVGQALNALPIHVIGDHVLLDEDADTLAARTA